MSTIETKPFLLLEDEALSYAQYTNRIAKLLHANVEYPRAEHQWPCQTCEPQPSACLSEPPALDKMFSVYMAAIVRLLQAKANNESTRPLVVHEPWVRAEDLKHGMLLVQPVASASPTFGILRTLPAQDEQPRQPEFTWSETLYQARKAAQEYSQETHADY
jgi:hypothetical protein